MCKSIKHERIFNINNLRGHALKLKAINQRWKFNKNTKNVQKHKRRFRLNRRNVQLENNVISIRLL